MPFRGPLRVLLFFVFCVALFPQGPARGENGSKRPSVVAIGESTDPKEALDPNAPNPPDIPCPEGRRRQDSRFLTAVLNEAAFQRVLAIPHCGDLSDERARKERTAAVSRAYSALNDRRSLHLGGVGFGYGGDALYRGASASAAPIKLVILLKATLRIQKEERKAANIGSVFNYFVNEKGTGSRPYFNEGFFNPELTCRGVDGKPLVGGAIGHCPNLVTEIEQLLLSSKPAARLAKLANDPKSGVKLARAEVPKDSKDKYDIDVTPEGEVYFKLKPGAIGTRELAAMLSGGDFSKGCFGACDATRHSESLLAEAQRARASRGESWGPAGSASASAPSGRGPNSGGGFFGSMGAAFGQMFSPGPAGGTTASKAGQMFVNRDEDGRPGGAAAPRSPSRSSAPEGDTTKLALGREEETGYGQNQGPPPENPYSPSGCIWDVECQAVYGKGGGGSRSSGSGSSASGGTSVGGEQPLNPCALNPGAPGCGGDPPPCTGSACGGTPVGPGTSAPVPPQETGPTSFGSAYLDGYHKAKDPLTKQGEPWNSANGLYRNAAGLVGGIESAASYGSKKIGSWVGSWFG